MTGRAQALFASPNPPPHMVRSASTPRWILPIFGLFLAVQPVPGGLAAQTLGGRFLDAVVDSIAEAHLASGQVPGFTVAAARGDDLLHNQGYGHADLEFGILTPLDAMYEIGSVTKQFTAVLTLMLAEEGLLDLEADISEYPPSFDTGGRAVPLKRLLDHTSGMKGYTESRLFFGAIHTQALPPDTLLRLMETEEWDFEPGEGLIYNNTAYFLLGRILEEVSGRSYAELLEERIFEPFGMQDTHYCDPARIVENRAKGYQASEDGLERAPYLDHRWPFAAGSVCSTARDLIVWNQALHGGEVLSPESYQLLITPEPLEDGSPTHYAKGLVHREDPYGEVIEHGGGIFGFTTDVRYYPAQELTLVVIQNGGAPGPDVVMDGLRALFLAEVEPVEASYPGDLSRLAGNYRGPSRGGVMELEVQAEGDALYARQGDGEEALLVHVQDGVFRAPDGTRMWFVGESGTPVDGNASAAGMRVEVGGGYGLYPLSRQGS